MLSRFFALAECTQTDKACIQPAFTREFADNAEDTRRQLPCYLRPAAQQVSAVRRGYIT